MKNFILSLFVVFTSTISFSQNFSITINPPTCFQACNGSIVYLDTVGVNGPFTAVVTNTGSCGGSTTQVSTANSLTVANLCACSSVYTISVYNSLNALVSYEFFQFPITSTAALVVTTPTIIPATCPTCCNGSVYVSWSGGYTPAPNNPTLTLDGDTINNAYFPNDSVCAGTHTICAIDLANCKVCVTFSMSHLGGVGVAENELLSKVLITPNPVSAYLTLSSLTANLFDRIKIFNINGKVVYDSGNKQSFELNTSINLSYLNAGIYFIELSNASNKLKLRQKLIKLDE